MSNRMVKDQLIDLEGAIRDAACDITSDNWKNLKNILDDLKPFKDAHTMLEGENHVTAAFVEQAVNHIREHLSLLPSYYKPRL